jgi:hypothetical protein
MFEPGFQLIAHDNAVISPWRASAVPPPFRLNDFKCDNHNFIVKLTSARVWGDPESLRRASVAERLYEHRGF